jgi:hypothetical protein
MPEGSRLDLGGAPIEILQATRAAVIPLASSEPREHAQRTLRGVVNLIAPPQRRHPSAGAAWAAGVSREEPGPLNLQKGPEQPDVSMAGVTRPRVGVEQAFVDAAMATAKCAAASWTGDQLHRNRIVLEWASGASHSRPTARRVR